MRKNRLIRVERKNNDKIVKVGGKVKDRLRSRGKLEMGACQRRSGRRLLGEV